MLSTGNPFQQTKPKKPVLMTGTTYYPSQPTTPVKPTTPTVGTGITYNASGSPTASTPTSGPTQDQQNALVVIDGILAEYGLQSLSNVVLGYVQQGYDASAINVLIQQTPEWKQRFSGNTIRQQNGLAPLDPGTYLATEAQYAQIIHEAGLPPGFYSGGQDFANWIGGNISPSEVQQRAQDAGALYNSQDPGVIQALAEQGIDKSQLTAYFLDPSKALPIIQNTYNAIGIGTAAADQGLNISAADSQKYAAMGVSQTQARNAYSQIAQTLPGAKTLADIYHVAYGQTNLEAELLGGSGAAANIRHTLANAEQAQFSGSGGAGATLQDPGYGVAAPTAGQF